MHSFDPKIAEMVGLAPAVIYQNICWWIAKNKANEDNFIDGHYWTYNSVRAFAILFPYLTEDQVRRALDKLVEHNLIVAGNHNKSAYDRTKWFRLSEQIDLAKLPNEFGTVAEPIPVVNTLGKLVVLDTNVSIANKPKSTRGTRIDPDWQPSQADLQHAFKKGLTNDTTREQAERFRDYWISKAGAGGVKLDWSATWRNWIASYCERSAKAGRSNPVRNNGKPQTFLGETLRLIKERENHGYGG